MALIHITKKISLIVCFLIIGFSASSQSVIAKIKYEDAEAAYQKKDYPLAITKLDEAEAILKVANPRTTYLRIMAQYKMLEDGGFNNFTLLESARKLSADYVEKYETIPNNEDKFKEIYRVLEALNKRPNPQVEAEKREIADKERPENSPTGLLEQFKFKLGLSVEDFKSYNKEAKEFMESAPRRIKEDGIFIWRNYENHDKGPLRLEAKNNKIISYTYRVAVSKNEDYLKKVYKNYSDLLNKLNPKNVQPSDTIYALINNISVTLLMIDDNVLIHFSAR
jgi:hypothetical protein